jgi:hypothetical protein
MGVVGTKGLEAERDGGEEIEVHDQASWASGILAGKGRINVRKHLKKRIHCGSNKSWHSLN